MWFYVTWFVATNATTLDAESNTYQHSLTSSLLQCIHSIKNWKKSHHKLPTIWQTFNCWHVLLPTQGMVPGYFVMKSSCYSICIWIQTIKRQRRQFKMNIWLTTEMYVFFFICSHWHPYMVDHNDAIWWYIGCWLFLFMILFYSMLMPPYFLLIIHNLSLYTPWTLD